LKVTDVSEEHIASIFRVEEYAEEETRVKAGGKQALYARRLYRHKNLK
jgi:hypothetical protein